MMNETILEAAFHDPSPAYVRPDDNETAYNEAVELRAKIKDSDEDSINSQTPSLASSTISTNPSYSQTEEEILAEMKKLKQDNKKKKNKLKWNCCISKRQEDVIILSKDEVQLSKEEIEMAKEKAMQRYKKENELREKHKAVLKQKREEAHEQAQNARRFKKQARRFQNLPEGVLVYQLNTKDKMIQLMSPLNPQSDTNAIPRQIYVTGVESSPDPTRRGVTIIDSFGKKHTFIACDQHTAITWLEAINFMLGNSDKKALPSEYFNLALFSQQLVQTTHESNNQSSTSVYYNIEVRKQNPENASLIPEESLEAIAKRRAIVKDSWDFYRMICSLLRDRRKYEEAFNKVTKHPVYPYFQSLSGLNDVGPKSISQKYLSKYRNMSRSEIVKDQIAQATVALPSLVEICKALAGSLGMEEVGVGPIKDLAASMKKADKKYSNDVLRITDYCRALLVVKDLPTLLAVLELARDSFGPLIRRVKLSSMKIDNDAIPGGYRDVKINVELKDHICEIQIHIWDMYQVCGVDGYRHYRHSLDYSTDSFQDPYQALHGLESNVIAEIIVIAEETVADVPLYNLKWYQEKFILNYFAEVGLFLAHGLYIWAEVTLKHLIQLRTQSEKIGPTHYETRQLQQYLVQALEGQGKKAEANKLQLYLDNYQNERTSYGTQDPNKKEKISTWEIFLDKTMDMCSIDPNRKQKEYDMKMIESVKSSKLAWKQVRNEKFKFLDDVSISDSSA